MGHTFEAAISVVEMCMSPRHLLCKLTADGHPDPCADGRRRAAAFGRALEAHLVKMRSEPGAYGQLGLSDLLEMREDCLREFRFTDVYRCCTAPESHFSGLIFTHALLTSM